MKGGIRGYDNRTNTKNNTQHVWFLIRTNIKMGRLTPENRVLVSGFRRQGIHINVIMNTFGISRVTVWYWGV